MDGNRFDAFARSLAQGQNRRRMLKGMLGLGGIAIASMATGGGTEAARRGYGGPIEYNPCDCRGRECGDDGCGGSCGTCYLPDPCSDAVCRYGRCVVSSTCVAPDACSIAACFDGACLISSSCNDTSVCVDATCCEYYEYDTEGCFEAYPQNPACYWPIDESYARCMRLDRCNGGLGYSGMCLKWAHASTDPPDKWQWDL